MNVDRFFYEHLIFRHEEFVNWKLQLGPIKTTSINMLLQYYVKSGRIYPLRRKLYAVIPPNQTAETLIVDPYLIAAKTTPDAVLGYHTALELLGTAYSSFSKFTYLTEQKSKPFEYQDQLFQPVMQPIILQKNQNTLLGIVNIDRQGLVIKITSASRTFVDVLDRVELCGGWEEVCRSIANFAVLNVGEVIQYCLLRENACLAAKVGYFLSIRQGAFAIDEEQLQPLIKRVPGIPQYASKRGQEKFQLVKKWNILLPETVINQSWEEPNVNF